MMFENALLMTHTTVHNKCHNMETNKQTKAEMLVNNGHKSYVKSGKVITATTLTIVGLLVVL